MNTDDWLVFNHIGGYSVPLSVDAWLFVKSFNKIFTIELAYRPDEPNYVILARGSLLHFSYNHPERVPEICEMVCDLDFVELEYDVSENQSDKSRLYQKAVIIRTHGDIIDEYAEKYIPRTRSLWEGYYEDNKLYMCDSEMDLSRVTRIFLFDLVPSDIGNHHFKYVQTYGINNIDELLKINTDILKVVADYLPDDWWRLLENVKYIILDTNARIRDTPANFVCNNLLAYNIPNFSGRGTSWKALDTICDSHRRKYGKTKSARS